MKETAEARAVKIAAKVMQAAGICRHESPIQCRRVFTDEKTCKECIRAWLMAKAQKELRRENGLEGVENGQRKTD